MTKNTKNFDIYKMVADRLIAQLDNGIIPWQKPWTGTTTGAYSYQTGKPYSLLNQFLLGKDGAWLTFKQIKDNGGKIRKGEKSSQVVFWKWLEVEATDKDGEPTKKKIPFLNYYNVWHIDQTEGIQNKWETKERPQTADSNHNADRIISDYLKKSGVKFRNIKGNKAYYTPATDTVTVPLMDQFANTSEYYSTIFHELTHSTGHKSRLDRLTKTAAFGSDDYGKEELVAEMGAAGLVHISGLETEKSFKNSTAYIQNWRNAIKADNKMVVYAASRAEKAIDLILNK